MDKKTIILATLAVLMVTNLISFFLMGHDKKCARQGKWRVPEKTLVSCYDMLWRPGRCAGDEGVSS